MTEAVCGCAELLWWQLGFTAMAFIALAALILAEPVSKGWNRAHKWLEKKTRGK